MSANSEFTTSDYQYMSQALQLAAQGLYSTSPNPRVGCVIVRNNQVVGQGAHIEAGQGHAEVIALAEAGSLAHGASAYVTLEPCSHHGRTPPCAEVLIQAGISKVVAAMVDPNPLVAGKGLEVLAAQGIQTQSGLMQSQAEQLNLGFIKRMRNGQPYVRLKMASSLDGKTALSNGESQWITAQEARQDVQHWRAQSCAVLTGIGTVLADNPSLNVRIDTSRQPLRVIIDSSLQTPLDAKVLQDNNVLIAYSHDAHECANALAQKGVALLHVPNPDGHVDLAAVLTHLASLQINEVLVEAGATLSGALFDAQLIDELILYYAPKMMGADARDMLTMQPLTKMSQVMDLTISDTRLIGRDMRLIVKPVYKR